VATAVRSHGEQAIAAAWLHDVAEDTGWTIQRLAQLFPAPVLDAVDALTRRPEESSHEYYMRVRSDPIALIVKLADIADNTDPGRLGQLPQSTAHRLLRKYTAALRELTRSPEVRPTCPSPQTAPAAPHAVVGSGANSL
jgi:(p)ppGpp synthase/HD superfamily hydrolase